MLGFVTTTSTPTGMQGRGAVLDAPKDKAGHGARDFLSLIAEDGPGGPQNEPVGPAGTQGADLQDETPVPEMDEDLLEEDPEAREMGLAQEGLEDDLPDLLSGGGEIEADDFPLESRFDLKPKAEGADEAENAPDPADAFSQGQALRQGAIPAGAKQQKIGVERTAPGTETAASAPVIVARGVADDIGVLPREAMTRYRVSENGAGETEGASGLTADNDIDAAKATARGGAAVEPMPNTMLSGPRLAPRSAEEAHASAVILPSVPLARAGGASEANIIGPSSTQNPLNTAPPGAVEAVDAMRLGGDGSAFALDMAAAPRAFAEMRQPVTANGQSVAGHIAVQVAEAVAKGGDRAIDILLNPSELGRVRITVTHGEAGLLVNVAAERPETLDLMRRHGEILGRSFEESGQGGAEFTFSRERGADGGASPDPAPEPSAALLLMPAGEEEALGAGGHMIAVDRLDIRL